MTYKFLLFDLDHTLLDFEAAEEVALTQMLEAEEVDDVTAYKAYYKPMNQQLWLDLEAKKISKEELVNSRFALLFEHFGKVVDGKVYAEKYQSFLMNQGQTFAGAKELLAELTVSGYQIYGATNGITRIQEGRLRASDIKPYFKQVFISEQTGYQKPDKEFFQVLADQIPGFAKDQALFIGDSLTADIQGGNNAGLDTVWYNPERKENTSPAIPTYTVTSYSELLQLLHGQRSE
ncbi:YjjG family noncanonical pyrimidine nucleotidase [Streptococcus downei]|uniref:Haloacid dehalogenase n=1 Tax=Streptococcus downei MFe28 TaxID=764290 RepID=A0A380JGI0_STRDO|nr:YjjG family noncanonical pyrimidine nucleotidase [Streptococcus downei]EFQ57634.1 HAD hydrolase, TIGR02254 family [Streptococcus downei F0415]SUN36549.1 haloacid dehalogenase [Streptococcus downei MFe28]